MRLMYSGWVAVPNWTLAQPLFFSNLFVILQTVCQSEKRKKTLKRIGKKEVSEKRKNA